MTAGRANRARKRQGGVDARDKAVEAALEGAAFPSKAEGHSRTPAPDAEVTAATLLYDRSQGRGPRQVHKKPGGARTTGGNAEAALPTNRGDTAAYISETTEAGRQHQSPHPPAAHAWLASRSPQTASGQRRQATAPVTTSGHEKRRGGSRDHDWSQRPPWRARESYCRDQQRAKSRDRSHQSDLGGADSGQKTVTETTRANAMKP